MTTDWQTLSDAQLGLLARRQLNALGIHSDGVRNHVAARRWSVRTQNVVSTFTGPLSWEHQVWLGVLHAGGAAVAGALTALEWHGLNRWHRDEITIPVDDELGFDPAPGIRFFRTRRPLGPMSATKRELPICRVEPAALLFAGYDRSPRTAKGLLAAVIQQRITDAESLAAELAAMRPLRRAALFRGALADISGGAQSWAELDVGRICRKLGLPKPDRQVRRRDSSGRLRFTDCEWRLSDRRTLVLEVDGTFPSEWWGTSRDSAFRGCVPEDAPERVLRHTTR